MIFTRSPAYIMKQKDIFTSIHEKNLFKEYEFS